MKYLLVGVVFIFLLAAGVFFWLSGASVGLRAERDLREIASLPLAMTAGGAIVADDDIAENVFQEELARATFVSELVENQEIATVVADDLAMTNNTEIASLPLAMTESEEEEITSRVSDTSNVSVVIIEKNENDGLVVGPDIDLQSVVGIYCDFKNAKGDQGTLRGSGVIINSAGYVLTSRHVVDIDYNHGQKTGYILDDCRVYFTELERTFPVEPQYQYIFFDINATERTYDFIARPVVVPAADQDNLSTGEEAKLDFALLQLSSWNAEKYAYDRKPPALHFSSLTTNYDLSQKVVMPGFSYQPLSASSSDSFNTLRLLTITGNIQSVAEGDRQLAGVPLYLQIKFDQPYVYGGHSGAPIFSNGYVIGLVTTKGQTGSEAVYYAEHTAMDAIVNILKKRGLTDKALQNYQE